MLPGSGNCSMAGFILWRAVNELYSSQDSLESVLPQESLLSEFGIGVSERQIFWKWATHFEKEYVGANQLAAYAQPVRKADLKDLQWSGENVRLTATLYMDLGRGYNETDAIHTDVIVKDHRYEVAFEIADMQQVRSMRFDPLEGTACICDLTSTQVELKPINASAKIRGGYEFLTMDPAYRLKRVRIRDAAQGEATVIRISGRVETKDLYWALAKSQELVQRYRRGPLGAVAGRLKR